MSKTPYGSETSRFRNDLIGFCEGYGVDIGYGGDPIKPSAISIDYPGGSMAYCGDFPLQLGGDARVLKWFTDNSLDYVYSSHCLEDFEDTKSVMVEWLRIIRKGGRLVLLLPDQQRYEENCRKTGQLPNAAHKIKEFGLPYLKSLLSNIPYTKVIFEKDVTEDYNFEIVIEKTGETAPGRNNSEQDNKIALQEGIIKDLENKIKKTEMKKQEKPYYKLKKACKKMFKKNECLDGLKEKVEQPKEPQGPPMNNMSPVAASPGTGPIPMPPVELRTIVGPTDEAVFDNPDGSLIWGELAFGPLKPGEAYSSIFDFGCGCGRNARQLLLQRKKPEKYTGIDIAPVLIEWCHNNLTPRDPNFRFMHHDVHSVTYAPGNSHNRHLPFPAGDGEYSLLNAHSVFTHLYYDQSEYYLKEARRIISEKGLIRSTWFFFNKKMFPVLAPYQHCLYVNELDPTQAVYYDWEQFLTLVHSLGLSVVSVIWTQVPGHANEVYLGKSETFNDISAGLTPPKTVLGF